MGGAASVENANNTEEKSKTQDTPSTRIRRFKERAIFDRQSITNINRGDVLDLNDGDELDEYEYDLVSKALKTFFFINESDSKSDDKVSTLAKNMKRERLERDAVLINEGESGNKLYIVETGELEVMINGEVIRTMGKGSMLGELALLYDAPRTATVKCLSDCVLWSLTREIFKQVQAMWGVAVQVVRSRGLILSPELAVLSAIDLSRLTAVLEESSFETFSKVFEEGRPSQSVTLIERGMAAIFTTIDTSKLTAEEIDKRLCIFRPKSMDMTTPPSAPPSTPHSTPPEGVPGHFACWVGPGCLVGIGALRGKAKLSDGWKWMAAVGSEDCLGAEAPLSMIAVEALTVTLRLCVLVYVCICVYVYMFLFICILKYICKFVCMYICMCTCMSILIYMHTC